TKLEEFHGDAMRMVVYRLLKFYELFVPLLNHATAEAENRLKEGLENSKLLSYGDVLAEDLVRSTKKELMRENGVPSEKEKASVITGLAEFNKNFGLLNIHFKDLLAAPPYKRCNNLATGKGPDFVPEN